MNFQRILDAEIASVTDEEVAASAPTCLRSADEEDCGALSYKARKLFAVWYRRHQTWEVVYTKYLASQDSLGRNQEDEAEILGLRKQAVSAWVLFQTMARLELGVLGERAYFQVRAGWRFVRVPSPMVVVVVDGEPVADSDSEPKTGESNEEEDYHFPNEL